MLFRRAVLCEEEEGWSRSVWLTSVPVKYWLSQLCTSPCSLLYAWVHREWTCSAGGFEKRAFVINNLQVWCSFAFFVDIWGFSALANHRWLNKCWNWNPSELEQTLVLFLKTNKLENRAVVDGWLNIKNEITGKSRIQLSDTSACGATNRGRVLTPGGITEVAEGFTRLSVSSRYEIQVRSHLCPQCIRILIGPAATGLVEGSAFSAWGSNYFISYC